jgi:hypothetical protein
MGLLQGLGRVLVLNAGSSSLKFKLFDVGGPALASSVGGMVDRIGDTANSALIAKAAAPAGGGDSGSGEATTTRKWKDQVCVWQLLPALLLRVWRHSLARCPATLVLAAPPHDAASAATGAHPRPRIGHGGGHGLPAAARVGQHTRRGRGGRAQVRACVGVCVRRARAAWRMMALQPQHARGSCTLQPTRHTNTHQRIRVVHGLDIHSAVALNEASIAKIRAASVLAPLHNPPGLQGIEAAMKVFGSVPQVCVCLFLALKLCGRVPSVRAASCARAGH